MIDNKHDDFTWATLRFGATGASATWVVRIGVAVRNASIDDAVACATRPTVCRVASERVAQGSGIGIGRECVRGRVDE